MAKLLSPEVKEITLSLLEGLSCPRALTVAILLRYEEWDQIIDMTIRPHDYCDSESYFAASAATSWLRKYPGLPAGRDTEAAAVKQWYLSEHKCYVTNQRLSRLIEMGPFGGPESERIMEFVSKVRKEVVNLIGVRPPRELLGAFGPGATISDRSTHATVGDKLSSLPTLTPLAWPWAVSWLETAWAASRRDWAKGDDLVAVKGNHFFTVPKDAKTDRGCAKEPSLNSFYQAALGRAMRKRMRTAGIDIRRGKEVHMDMARKGSISGLLSTIDLSSASDTVATSLVKLVIPEAWHNVLCQLRSPFTLIEGRWVRLEKFSSMGNGFTFELETVIFCSIARACQTAVDDYEDVKVFGDDIIVPTSSFREVIAALRFFGFAPNEKKTFSDGEFRESCGGDFFRGTAVRPYHLEGFSPIRSSFKGEPCEPQHFISIANGIRRLAGGDDTFRHRWPLLIRAWFRTLDFVPVGIRKLRGPKALGDLVIHDDESKWITRSRKTTPDVRYVRVYRPVAKKFVRFEGFAYTTQMAIALYLAGSGPKSRTPAGDLVPRDPVTGYKVGWTPFS